MKTPRSLRIVINSLAIGGTERHLSYILPELKRKGWQIRVILLNRSIGPDLTAFMREAGISVYAYPSYMPRVGRPMVNLVRLCFDFMKDRQSITHFFLPQAYLLGGLAAQLTRLPAPRLMSRRSMNVYQKKHRFLKHLERALHPSMDMILANSQAVLNQLQREEKVKIDQLALIYNGIRAKEISAQDRSQFKHALGLSKNCFVISMVANVLPYKGHQVLLNALAEIRLKLGEDWTCMMIGRETPLLLSLKDYTQQAHLESHVQWMGVRDDVSALLSVSDVMVLCSDEEGFSNAIIEAMAQACATVVTSVGGNAEAVIDGETGMVVPPQNPRALAEAILKIYQAPELRQQYGARARLRQAQCFSLDTCVAAYEKVYDQVH